jgi:hypothetical protein
VDLYSVLQREQFSRKYSILKLLGIGEGEGNSYIIAKVNIS